MPASFSSHPIKLIDIARQAGVTPAVVSHVLNNRQSTIRVSARGGVTPQGDTYGFILNNIQACCFPP